MNNLLRGVARSVCFVFLFALWCFSQDLGDIDPGLLKGFHQLRDYDGGDDEDVFGLDFRVTWDDLGMERTHDLVKGGANIPVTSENKESYVELYAQFLLVGAVSRQMDHFKQGFLRVMSGAASISLFRAEELEVLVTGTSELDFEELAKATEYDGGYGEDHRTILAFWRAVGRMPAEEQRRLLMFVTGSKKNSRGGDDPAGGAGHGPPSHGPHVFQHSRAPGVFGRGKVDEAPQESSHGVRGFRAKVMPVGSPSFEVTHGFAQAVSS
ncbi:unnamed protein product [Ectocarpus sp. 4 AP-2014]